MADQAKRATSLGAKAGYAGDGTKADLDNHANQGNPNHEKTNPGYTSGYGGVGTKVDLDNHANQGNPNHEKTNPHDK